MEYLDDVLKTINESVNSLDQKFFNELIEEWVSVLNENGKIIAS